MSAENDIRRLLQEWPYDQDNSVRVLSFPDGRQVLQVRLPLGIEQYEMDGRPDGLRPHHMETALEYHVSRLARLKAIGKQGSFRLTRRDCVELFEEGMLYYYRYLHLFQLQEWERTVRDTARNIALFDFVRRYAAREKDRIHLEQWRPYVVRINTVAQAMIELRRGRYLAAADIVREAIGGLEALPALQDSTFKFELDRSLQVLRRMADQIDRNRPLGEVERLEKELQNAVETEEFERAADLRDRIRSLRDAPAP